MPSTIRDVARRAGVSVTTAHRGINGKGELSDATRERVLAAARDLNYVPSATARALVFGRTQTIGMVVTDNASPVYAGIVRGVEEVVNRVGFGLLLCNSADDQIRALSCVDLLRAKQVDGVLLTPVQTSREDVDALREAGIPYVLLLRHFSDPVDPAVLVDNETAGYVATRHLLDLGHRRIGHVAGPEHVSSARERLAGYRRALGEVGAAFEPEIVAHGAYTIEGGYRATSALLDRTERPTALFAANDLQAVGVMKATGERGLAIPNDLALVGGDDIELAGFLATPLTTFHQPALEIGRRGAAMLLARLQDGDIEPRQDVLTPELIVRASSGGPV
jgi:LacI family transcriptional regulator